MTAHTRTDKRKHLFILSMSDYQCLFLAHNLCYFIMLVWKWYQTWTWFISFLLLLILIKVVSCLKKYMLRKHQCHILTALHDTLQRTYQWLHKKHGIFYLLDFPALDCHLWINHCALWEWLNFTSRISISVILLQWEACKDISIRYEWQKINNLLRANEDELYSLITSTGAGQSKIWKTGEES